jgi:hypothetical protein
VHCRLKRENNCSMLQKKRRTIVPNKWGYSVLSRFLLTLNFEIEAIETWQVKVHTKIIGK